MTDYITKSGNIFKDLVFLNSDEELLAKVIKRLGFPHPDKELLVKTKLASKIDRLIRDRNMSEKEAADFLGISQSKTTQLQHSQLKGFTIDYLFSLLKKLDHNIERRLLEEYKEQAICWRHDDEVFSKLTAVLLPLAIAALTLPYLKTGAPKLLAVFGGLMLITLWYIPSLNYRRRFEVRFSRIHEIEWILGFDSHLRYHRESNKNVLKDRYLRCCLFIIYIVIALIVTCEIKVEATNPKAAHIVDQFIHIFSDTRVETALRTIDFWSTDAWTIKLVITVETIIVSTVALFFIDICTCILAWKRVGKRTMLKKWCKSNLPRKPALIN